MFIVWGKKRRAKNRGIAAEFCPVCRGLQRCRARELHLVPHLYYVQVGRAEVIGAEVQCAECGWFVGVPVELVRAASKERGVDLESLSAATSALGRDGLAERLALEKRAACGQVSGEERFSLLREPFEGLSYRAAVMRLRGRGESIIAVVAAMLVFGLCGLGMGLFEVLSPGRPEPWLVWTAWISAAVVAVTLPATVWLIVASKRHAASRYAVPMLARALGPLRPTMMELEGVLAECRGMPSAEGVTARRLLDLMERERGQAAG